MEKFQAVKDMHRIQLSTRHILKSLAEEIGADFTALALYDPAYSEIRWKTAFGARNGQYKRIAVIAGKGIPGDILRNKSPFVVTDFKSNPPGDPLEYPILQLEQLCSAAALPIGQVERAYGFLLAGVRRSDPGFAERSMNALEGCARQLLEICEDSEQMLPPLKVNLEQPLLATPLLAFLFGKYKQLSPWLSLDVIDQQIAKLPLEEQYATIEAFQVLLAVMEERETTYLRFTIERMSDSRMTIDIKSDLNIEHPYQELGEFERRIRLFGGDIRWLHEPGMLRIRLSYPNHVFENQRRA